MNEAQVMAAINLVSLAWSLRDFGNVAGRFTDAVKSGKFSNSQELAIELRRKVDELTATVDAQTEGLLGESSDG